MTCDLCTEPVYAEGPMHRECMLREVMGGIGHLLDHDHFCVERHDPDAGLPYRLSALLVDTYVAYKGVETSVNVNGSDS